MGTDWWLCADGVGVDTLSDAQPLVDELEQRFSRFRAASALSRLNRERSLRDPELAALLSRAQRMHEATDGAFDIAIGDAVIASGYDRSFESFERIGGVAVALPTDVVCTARPSIEVVDECVQLTGAGSIDLGGIAKGWTVDRVGQFLATCGASSYVVDAGGDILVRSANDEEQVIGVGDGLAVGLSCGAVATSSTLQRRWRTSGGEAHHIVDPSAGVPADERVRVATVVASSATDADALATAIVADPERGLTGVRQLGAEALICDARGEWHMTAGMGALLR